MDYFPSLCDTSRLLLWDKVIHFLATLFSHRTVSSGFAFAFGNLLYIDNLRLPEDLPKHHPCWLEELDPQHFHFSGKVLQATIIPGQSDITLVAGFFATPDRFRILSWFSSELKWSTFQRLLPLPVYPSILGISWILRKLWHWHAGREMYPWSHTP